MTLDHKIADEINFAKMYASRGYGQSMESSLDKVRAMQRSYLLQNTDGDHLNSQILAIESEGAAKAVPLYLSLTMRKLGLGPEQSLNLVFPASHYFSLAERFNRLNVDRSGPDYSKEIEQVRQKL